MKRLKVKEAFAGRATSDPEKLKPYEDAEAVVLAVRGGELVAVVPSGTADESVIGSATTIRGAVRLENERVLTFEIQRPAASASFEDEAASLRSGYPRPAVSRADAAREPVIAEEIMTRQVITASADELVEDVAKRLAFHNISGMPVEDWDGKIIGVVSEADVIQKIGETIGDVMTAEVIGVGSDTPIAQVAVLMAERRIKRVPVLDNGMLLGIISRADIVRAMAAKLAE